MAHLLLAGAVVGLTVLAFTDWPEPCLDRTPGQDHVVMGAATRSFMRLRLPRPVGIVEVCRWILRIEVPSSRVVGDVATHCTQLALVANHSLVVATLPDSIPRSAKCRLDF